MSAQIFPHLGAFGRFQEYRSYGITKKNATPNIVILKSHHQFAERTICRKYTFENRNGTPLLYRVPLSVLMNLCASPAKNLST